MFFIIPIYTFRFKLKKSYFIIFSGKDDALVQTVLKGINPEVREKGIVTEKTLRDKFDAVNVFYYIAPI